MICSISCTIVAFNYKESRIELHFLYEFHSIPRSTLPPESIMPMQLQSFHEGFCLKLSERTAARPIAPLGSTTTFSTSRQSLIASTISVSSTVITSSTKSLIIGLISQVGIEVI